MRNIHRANSYGIQKLSWWYLLGAVTAWSPIIAAVIIEQLYFLQPCLLCSLQRLMFGLVGTGLLLSWLVHLFLTNFIFNNGGNLRRWLKNFAAIFTLLGSGVGIMIAGRQFWLQNYHRPMEEEVFSSCVANWYNFLKYTPVKDWVTKVLAVAGDCAKVDFIILHRPLSFWSLVLFGFFVLYSLVLLLRKAE